MERGDYRQCLRCRSDERADCGADHAPPAPVRYEHVATDCVCHVTTHVREDANISINIGYFAA